MTLDKQKKAVQLRENFLTHMKDAQTAMSLADTAKSQLQSMCEHPSCAELTPNSEKPRRICITCGVEEAGGRTGYNALKNSTVVLDCKSDSLRFHNLRRLNFELVPIPSIDLLK